MAPRNKGKQHFIERKGCDVIEVPARQEVEVLSVMEGHEEMEKITSLRDVSCPLQSQNNLPGRKNRTTQDSFCVCIFVCRGNRGESSKTRKKYLLESSERWRTSMRILSRCFIFPTHPTRLRRGKVA